MESGGGHQRNCTFVCLQLRLLRVTLGEQRLQEARDNRCTRLRPSQGPFPEETLPRMTKKYVCCFVCQDEGDRIWFLTQRIEQRLTEVDESAG